MYKRQILIDGINRKDWPLHDLRRNLGFVPQKGILFSGTIRSNLAYGDRDAGEEQILKAAGIAQAMEFIESKPDLFDTLIAQGEMCIRDSLCSHHDSIFLIFTSLSLGTSW